jgi:hypothetical protein
MNQDIARKTVSEYLNREASCLENSHEFKEMCACKHRCLCFVFHGMIGKRVEFEVFCQPLERIVQTTFRKIAWKWHHDENWTYGEVNKSVFSKHIPGNHVLMCEKCQSDPKFMRRNSI